VKIQIQKITPANRGGFLLVYSRKYLGMIRFAIILSLFLPQLALAQIVPDPSSGLEGYFEGWYKEAARAAKKSKKKKGIEKEIISLYLAAVNGRAGSDGNTEHLSRVMPPRGKYSLVQNFLFYHVVEQLPERGKEDYYNPSRGWAEVIDSIAQAMYSSEKMMEPLRIHPDKFRVPGLPLDEKRNKELREFLDADVAKKENSENDPWAEPAERMVRGKHFDMISQWVGLIQPHWGNRWIYKSFPTVSVIIIDKKSTQALLRYGIHNGGGYAHFKKTKSGWEPTESRINILQ
jgi:hypothetical protein